ncbi:MAG TPA: 3'-5' exonuclease [Solirubrobacteraceae bacterium]|nr:3'-5' exonuclease [Solirubrobacteraceae bacterium]
MRLRRRPELTPAGAAFAAASSPPARTPWRSASWLAVDLELTRLHPAGEIIAIGAVPIEHGEPVESRALYTLVRPLRPPPPETVAVHGLTEEDLRDAPAIDEALEALLEALAGRVPVFHTGRVERHFLGLALRGRRLRLPADADTEQLGRRWLSERGARAPAAIPLTTLAQMLGVPCGRAHHALGDALTTARTFVALATLLETRGRQTVGTLRAP